MMELMDYKQLLADYGVESNWKAPQGTPAKGLLEEVKPVVNTIGQIQMGMLPN